RSFLKAAAVAAGAATLAACSTPPSPTPEPAKPAAPAPAAAAPTTAPAAAAKPADNSPAAQAAAKPAEPTKPAAAAPAAGGAPAGPSDAAKPNTAGLKPVARNRTLMHLYGGVQGKYPDYELWNPYAVGANHQTGPNLYYEPVAYYSAFADKELLWLAESYEYSPDFKQLTIKTRSGINWSDGKPFMAEDIAFTLRSLKQLAAKVRWGVDVEQFVEDAQAPSANQVVIKFKAPNPRWFYFMTYKYDIGIYPVPKHIYDGQDWTTFKAFDLAKDWPVTTGPWKLVAASPD